MNQVLEDPRTGPRITVCFRDFQQAEPGFYRFRNWVCIAVNNVLEYALLLTGLRTVFVKLGGFLQRFVTHVAAAGRRIRDAYEFSRCVRATPGLEIGHRKLLRDVVGKLAIRIVAAKFLENR